MYSQGDISSLYGFLKSTNEGNLRKMLVSGQFTEVYFKLLLKVTRGCPEAEFITHFEQGTFPKIKLNGPEIEAKEKFWGLASQAFEKMGLLTKQAKAA